MLSNLIEWFVWEQRNIRYVRFIGIVRRKWFVGFTQRFGIARQQWILWIGIRKCLWIRRKLGTSRKERWIWLQWLIGLEWYFWIERKWLIGLERKLGKFRFERLVRDFGFEWFIRFKTIRKQWLERQWSAEWLRQSVRIRFTIRLAEREQTIGLRFFGTQRQ